MQSVQNNQERTEKELARLEGGLRPFVISQMRRMYGASWQQEAQKSLRRPRWTRRGHLHLDRSALLYVLRDQWKPIFHQVLGPAERVMIGEVVRMRNKSSHQEAITDNEVEQLHKHVENLLTWIDSGNAPPHSTFTQTSPTNPFPWWNSSSQPTFTQTSPTSPSLRPKETTNKVTRRVALVVFIGTVVVGVPLLCELSQRGYSNTIQPDPTEPGQQSTPISLNQPLFTYTGHAKSVNAVAWSPNGQRIASGSDDTTVQVWNASNGTHPYVYHGHTDVVRVAAWSPDSKSIASGSGAIEFGTPIAQVWNASDGTQTVNYTGHSGYGGVTSVAWSPDGQHIASGSDSDNTAQVWNASDGTQTVNYTGHSGSVNAVAWSPNGRRIASGSDDGTAQVWNASDGSHAFPYRGHSGSVNAVAWSPDGKRIASASSDKTVQVWDSSNGTHLLTYQNHSDSVNTVAWSPDGKRIASASSDKTVQVWSASDGTQTVNYTGHTQTVTSVTWSPESRLVASGSQDMTVQVWQAV